MSDVKQAFGTSTTITCTLASLADAGARECTAIDNSSNLYLDAMLYLAIKLQTGSTTGNQAIFVWFYGSEDGTNYTDNATGSDAAVTMRSPSNLRGPFVISAPDSGALTYKAVIASVASFFGGVLPKKWGFVIENKTGITFDATEGNHTKTYTGVYVTSV
jgi:hypothetical protein